MEGPEIEETQQQGRPQWGRRQQPQRPQGLCDLHGLGFTKNGKLDTSEYTHVPQVTITADGHVLSIPQAPVYTSNANGYTDATHYQVYAPLTDSSKLQATSANPAVKFEISPITAGRATVKATYRGKTKTYLIN